MVAEVQVASATCLKPRLMMPFGESLPSGDFPYSGTRPQMDTDKFSMLKTKNLRLSVFIE